jgi:hypothetical protein
MINILIIGQMIRANPAPISIALELNASAITKVKVYVRLSRKNLKESTAHLARHSTTAAINVDAEKIPVPLDAQIWLVSSNPDIASEEILIKSEPKLANVTTKGI